MKKMFVGGLVTACAVCVYSAFGAETKLLEELIAIPLVRSVAATDARCFYDCGTTVAAIGAKGSGDHGSDERVSLIGIDTVTELLVDFLATKSPVGD